MTGRKDGPRSESALRDLRLAYEFLTRADMSGERTEPTRFGTAVFDDRVPRRYDSNSPPLETTPAGTSAEELAADARAHGRPMILVRDVPAAEPLVPRFQALGWRIDRHVLMAQRGAVVGGEIVAYADVYIEAPTAQIEDVGTLEEHRGHGYASAVVLYAAETARRAGADFVFLVADAHDWPQHLYRRLGFEPIGHYMKFIAPGI